MDIKNFLNNLIDDSTKDYIKKSITESVRNFRKTIFINSQYCTYCIDKKQTVAAGIMRNVGYKFQERFSDEQIDVLNKLYRKNTTILNCAVAAEIIIYIYGVLIPYFEQFIKMPYFLAALIFSIPPLVALFLTYVVINKLYEKKLEQFGSFELVKFRPNIYNVETKAFEKYINTKRKSWIIMLIALFIFVYFAFTPIYVDKLNEGGHYKFVTAISKIYIKLIPISSDMYAQRAYSYYKTQNYEKARKDFEKANLYSNSNVYDVDIMGLDLITLPFKDADKKITEAINMAETDEMKNFLTYQRAILLQKNKDYKGAIAIYNRLVNLFNNKIYEGFNIDAVYYYRGLAKESIGDIKGAKSDKNEAIKMCPTCKFKLELDIVRQP